MWLDGAVLGGTTAVVGAEVLLADDEPAVGADRETILGTADIASIRGVDASRLVLSGVDLSSCRFSAAYQLDRLRIEGRCRFGTTPVGVRRHEGFPPLWWWTRRRTIIEEHRWRARQPRRPEGWTVEYSRASRTFGYWLFSGYGLRAGRALLGLAGLVALTTLLLTIGGFVDPAANTENALRTALDAVVFRATTEELTTTGAYVEMVARVLGPVLLALAALSVRNRVKR